MRYFNMGNAHRIVEGSQGREVVVVALNERPGTVDLHVGVSESALSPAECRQLATALLVAADMQSDYMVVIERAEDV